MSVRPAKVLERLAARRDENAQFQLVYDRWVAALRALDDDMLPKTTRKSMTARLDVEADAATARAREKFYYDLVVKLEKGERLADLLPQVQEPEAPKWEPTHFSASDGSPARLVDVVGRSGLFENEDGYRWQDNLDKWTLISDQDDDKATQRYTSAIYFLRDKRGVAPELDTVLCDDHNTAAQRQQVRTFRHDLRGRAFEKQQIWRENNAHLACRVCDAGLDPSKR